MSEFLPFPLSEFNVQQEISELLEGEQRCSLDEMLSYADLDEVDREQAEEQQRQPSFSPQENSREMSVGNFESCCLENEIDLNSDSSDTSMSFPINQPMLVQYPVQPVFVNCEALGRQQNHHIGWTFFHSSVDTQNQYHQQQQQKQLPKRIPVQKRNFSNMHVREPTKQKRTTRNSRRGRKLQPKSVNQVVEKLPKNSTGRGGRRKRSKNDQKICCVGGCKNEISNRLRFSLRCHQYEDFKRTHLQLGYDRVCHYHYFSDLYRYKKEKKKERD